MIFYQKDQYSICNGQSWSQVAPQFASLFLLLFFFFFFPSFSLLNPSFSLAGLLYAPPYLFLPCLMNKRLHGLSFIFIFDKEDAIFLISEFISITKEKANRQEEVLTHICLSACISRSLLFCNFLLVLAKAHYQVDLRNQTSAQQEWERKKNRPTSIVHHRTAVGAVSVYSGGLSSFGCSSNFWSAVDERPETENSLVRPERILAAQGRDKGERVKIYFGQSEKKCSLRHLLSAAWRTSIQQQQKISHPSAWVIVNHGSTEKRARDSRISLGSWEDS